MAKNHGIARRAVSVVSSVALALSLCPFGQALAIELGGQPSELTDSAALPLADNAVYAGDPTSGDGDGTKENPFSSLSDAIGEVSDGGTVYVSSDIELESMVWIGKSVNIVGVGDDAAPTISRANNFSTAQDPRGTYNPAMFQVYKAQTSASPVKVSFSNVTLDDKGIREGEHLVQADSTSDTGKTAVPVLYSNGQSTGETIEVGNDEVAQDAMIATYDASCEIVLGQGAVLKNFGGMSAVRVAPGTLTMLKGSSIVDDVNVNRDRPKESPATPTTSNQYGNGVAGAVWVQGGVFNMESDSHISSIKNARAIYLDGGSARIDGTIGNIQLSNQSWQGVNGALHVRNAGTATFSGFASGVSGNGGSVVFVVGGVGEDGSGSPSDFTMVDGSKISDSSVKAVQIFGNNPVNATIDGEITGIEMDNAVNINVEDSSGATLVTGSHKVVIGEHADIHDNVVVNGAVYIQTVDGTLDIYGKIRNNINGYTFTTDGRASSGGLYMAHNHKDCTVILHSGSEISGNVANKYAGLIVSKGTCIMESGSKVDGNISAEDFGGVFVRNGGKFTMESGSSASNNVSAGKHSGIALETTSGYAGAPFASIEGGSITGNIAEATVTGTVEDGASYIGGTYRDVSITNTPSYANISRYMTFSNEAMVSTGSVYMEYNGGTSSFDVSAPSEGVKFGNASKTCEEKATGTYGVSNLDNVVGSFWFQSKRASETFAISELSNLDTNKPVYAAVVPTAEDGTCDSQKSASLVPAEVDENGLVKVTVPVSETTGQAVVFLQERDQSANVVSIKPADLTAYMGGESGYTYVDEQGKKVDLKSIPTPGFKVDIPDAWDINDIRLKANVDDTEYVWKLVKYSEGSTDVFSIVPEGANGIQVKFQFIDESGEAVSDDEFGFEKSLGQELVMRAYGDGIAESDVTVTHNGSETAVLASGTGVLTVRGTTEHEQYALPNAGLTTGAPGLKPSEGTKYTINGGGSLVGKNGKVALLFDDIIETDGKSTNADLLEKHAQEAYFKDNDGERNYEFKYLDLVDQNNGNVWVKASEPVTVCWPLPEGTDSEDEFTVLHFKGLHREMGVGYIASEIEKADVEKLDCRVVGDHVEFKVTPGNFSPFALVWTEDGGGSVTPPQPQTVTLHYETNGGRSLADETHVLGTKADLKTPLREGCTFAGWYLDEALTKPAESPLLMDTDKTVWAKWESTSVPGDFTSDHVNYVLGRETEEGRLIDPESNVTRAEVAAMLYRLLDEEVRSEYYRESSTFPDVEEGAWYEVPVATLQVMGIIKGDEGTGACRPNDPITRAEFAAMAGRFDDDGEWPDMEPFTDMDGHWAERIVLVAAVNGWILGDEGSDRFRPDDPITRAETIAIMNRVLQRIPESEADLLPGRVEWPDNHDVEKWYWLAVEEATNNHDHTMKGDGVHERWTALLENEDWGE